MASFFTRIFKHRERKSSARNIEPSSPDDDSVSYPGSLHPRPTSRNQQHPAVTMPHPELICIDPRSGKHKHSFVILHGRGSNAEMFSHALLHRAVPEFGDLQTAFPDAKLIFPTASKRRMARSNGATINQWFDNWSLEQPEYREEVQFEGLKETSTYVRDLLKKEVEAVGAKNVVLWGLSQGCAVSLISLLLWEGEPLAAMVGMCGWLPLRKRMKDAVVPDDLADADDPVRPEKDEDVGERGLVSSKIDQAATWLREELDLPSPPATLARASEIPIFLGHGVEDSKVPLHLARDATTLLRQLEFDVTYREYERLGHWYSSSMLRDIVTHIQARLGYVDVVNFTNRPEDVK